MNNHYQKFYRALSLLNSLFVPVCILSIIDTPNLFFLFKPGFVLSFLIKGVLKVYCISAIGGSVLGIISGEDYVLRLRQFHQNAKNLWPGFLVGMGGILLVDFILFAAFPSSAHSWRPFYFDLMGVLSAYILSQWAIKRKYLKPLGIHRRGWKFSLALLMGLVSACLLELIVVRVTDFIHLGHLQPRSVSIFILNYIHVFEFILCSLYIMDDYPQINENFKRSNEVFLINPMFSGISQGIGFWAVRGYPPFFVVLRALTPKTYAFREFDQVIWHDRYYKTNALVCITCFTSNCYEAYKIAKEFKKRGSKVVMGGPHTTFFPNEALAFCDSVVIGQAEGIWKDVICDYEQGTLKSQYKGPATDEDHAQVHEELLNSPADVSKEFLETSRGCKFKCHFCTIPANSDGKLRFQSIDNFVDLIKKIKPHESNVTFIDNNIYSDPGYAKELFTALKPLKIKWSSECSIDIGKNEGTVALARESGCNLLGIGYEVSGVSLEKKQGGKFAMAQKYLEYSRNIKRAGIKIKGQFIYGFDSDNLVTLFNLWRFVFSLRPMVTALSVLTPLPGAGVYRDMLNQNRIISLNWRSYTCHKLVVRHPNLNPKVMTFFYPFLQVFFFLTASSIGLCITAACFFNLACLIIIHFLKP